MEQQLASISSRAPVASHHASWCHSHSPTEHTSLCHMPSHYDNHSERSLFQQLGFQSSTGPQGVLSACAVCLGQHPHNMHACNATHTWDSTHPVMAKWKDKQLFLLSNNPHCHQWQQVGGCTNTTHNHHHCCTGCGSATHGVDSCPQALRSEHQNSI